MNKSLLHKIAVDIVGEVKLYRLGVFDNSSFDLAELKESGNYPAHHHHKSEAKFYFISGEGFIILNGKKHRYKKGDTFTIPKGMKHGFQSKTETLFLSIQTPPIKDPKTGKEDLF